MRREPRNAIYRLTALIGGISLLLLLPSELHAQGCALCYQSAAASGSQFIQALKNGILILLIPPILISAGIFVMAYRKRNQCWPSWRVGETAAAEQHGD